MGLLDNIRDTAVGFVTGYSITRTMEGDTEVVRRESKDDVKPNIIEKYENNILAEKTTVSKVDDTRITEIFQNGVLAEKTTSFDEFEHHKEIEKYQDDNLVEKVTTNRLDEGERPYEITIYEKTETFVDGAPENTVETFTDLHTDVFKTYVNGEQVENEPRVFETTDEDGVTVKHTIESDGIYATKTEEYIDKDTGKQIAYEREYKVDVGCISDKKTVFNEDGNPESETIERYVTDDRKIEITYSYVEYEGGKFLDEKNIVETSPFEDDDKELTEKYRIDGTMESKTIDERDRYTESTKHTVISYDKDEKEIRNVSRAENPDSIIISEKTPAFERNKTIEKYGERMEHVSYLDKSTNELKESVTTHITDKSGHPVDKCFEKITVNDKFVSQSESTTTYKLLADGQKETRIVTVNKDIGGNMTGRTVETLHRSNDITGFGDTYIYKSVKEDYDSNDKLMSRETVLYNDGYSGSDKEVLKDYVDERNVETFGPDDDYYYKDDDAYDIDDDAYDIDDDEIDNEIDNEDLEVDIDVEDNDPIE